MLARVSREPTLAVDMSPCRAVVMSAVSVDNGDRHTGQQLTFADICRVVLTARGFHPSDSLKPLEETVDMEAKLPEK